MDVLPSDDLEGYFGAEFDQAIGYDESLSDDKQAEQIMTQEMIDAEFGELRVLQSNMLLYVLFASIFAMALLAKTVKLCFKRVNCVRKISEIVWRAIFFNLLLRTAIETQLEVSVKNMIKLLIVSTRSNYEIVESIIAYGSIICLFAFAMSIPCFLNKNE